MHALWVLTQDEYISWWKSDKFRLSSIIKEDVSNWYQTEMFTVTATDGTVYTFTNKTNYTVSDGETTSVKEREEIFDLLYNKYSANDWELVKAEFKPYLFSYEKNKTVTESYIGEDNSFKKMDVTYDYYLTQHYSVPKNAIFLYGDDSSAAEKTIAVFTGLRGQVSTVSAGKTQTTVAFIQPKLSMQRNNNVFTSVDFSEIVDGVHSYLRL